MRVLFSVLSPAHLKNFESVVRLLADRGHRVHLAVHQPTRARGAAKRFDVTLSRECELVSTHWAPGLEETHWHHLAKELRACRDYMQFLEPTYHDRYRERAERRASAPFRRLISSPVGRREAVRDALARAIPALGTAMPIDKVARRHVAGISPDIVLFTPYIGLRTPQPDYLRAAQSLGIRTVVCVSSWDNLSSKSALWPLPDVITVWNATQEREAVELHAVPPDKVTVTGAQCFDEWFGWSARPREEFCHRVGLDPERPYILYTCFSPFLRSPSEPRFVLEWIDRLRTSGDPLLQRAGVLIRPHPKRGGPWEEVDVAALDNVAIWPPGGQMVVDEEAKADYYDSIHHSAAVMGVNTSAMIEAGIVGRAVHTLLVPEFWESQEGTVHFRYLLEVGGGLVRVGRDYDEHLRQLSESMRHAHDGDHSASRFVEDFIRPHGIDVPATPVFVDALERLVRLGPTARHRSSLRGLALRPLLMPLAAAAARSDRAERETSKARARLAKAQADETTGEAEKADPGRPEKAPVE